LALALLAGALAVPARAADLPAPAQGYYPPVYAPPALYDWTGLYLGANVGAGLLSDNVTQAAPGLTTLTGNTLIGPVGLVGGAQGGVNYQFGGWVVGAEAAWSATNISGSGTVLTTTPSTERATSAPWWFASATGRLGYAANTLLGYVKGGGAWMHTSYTQNILGGGSQSMDDSRTGFTAGIGLEYGLTEHFSAKFEYDFYDFGTKTYNQFVQTPVAVRSDLHTLIFGLNYRFTWPGGGPVVAKY
jgi:high affinity Mn2+ porin